MGESLAVLCLPSSSPIRRDVTEHVCARAFRWPPLIFSATLEAGTVLQMGTGGLGELSKPQASRLGGAGPWSVRPAHS